MNTYILTCDKTVDKTMEMVEYSFKKYWSSTNVTVLGYKPPTYKSDTIKFDSLGKDEGPNIVCKQLYDYFSKIDDKHFIFCVDDMPLIEKVDNDMISYVTQLVELNTNIGRFGLTLDNSSRSHEKTILRRYNIIRSIFNPDDCLYSYKMSCTYSIWNCEYFLLYLNDFDNLWNWECYGSQTSVRNDEWEVLGIVPGILYHAHIFKEGKVRRTWYDSANNNITNTKKTLSIEDQNKIKEIYKL
tara:strand:- start:154 stop:879 length:726 start_codon:yes stop_codon:yes gene_type:complete